MFYSKYKKQVLEDYGKALAEYNDIYGKTQREVQRLYERRRISIELIRKIEALVNSIANRPKEYDIITQRINFEREKFHEKEEYAEQACHEAKKAGVNIAAGVAGGTAVAAAAPTAALWVATTFGTASTGTAISALSGAAATNAALAWLGGGALSVGGAGVAGGQALPEDRPCLCWRDRLAGLSLAALLSYPLLYWASRIRKLPTKPQKKNGKS